MHDLNLNLFYKTKFDIVAKNPTDDVLWRIVLVIKAWMVSKWKRNGVSIPNDVKCWSRFKNGSHFSSDDNATVRLTSASFEDKDHCKHWACKILETSSVECRAPREWVIEIGFEQIAQNQGTLSLVLSYGDRPGFIGLCQDEPQPSVPNFIKRLVAKSELKCSISGLPLTLAPTELRVGDFPDFFKLISCADREVPIIYISPARIEGEEGTPLIDPHELAQTLGPNALIYYSRSRDFSDEMRSLIPNHKLRCTDGTVRVYAARPAFDNPDDCYRHRFFSARKINELTPKGVVSILRRALAQDVFFYETMIRIEAVKEMRRKHEAEERVKSMKQGIEAEALEDMIASEEKLIEVQAKCDSLSEERDRLKAENYSIKNERDSFLAALSARPDGELGEGIDLSEFPPEPRTIAEIFKAAYPDRIDFTERGWSTLEKCKSSPETVWNALNDLCVIAYDLLATQIGIDVAAEFNSRSNFEYARGEGSNTRKNTTLIKRFEDTYCGRILDVQRHLKKGTREADEKFIRLYFAYDKTSGKIIVSSCGPHLENSTTSKIH